MRLWSIHPRYLDPAGLVAVWREGLLAQAVLRGRTRGYRHHPQLDRFRAQPSPIGAINAYLVAVHREATERGYTFNAALLGRARHSGRIVVSRGQVEFEWMHLLDKLRRRNPPLHRIMKIVKRPTLHPLFRAIPGPIAVWERIPDSH